MKVRVLCALVCAASVSIISQSAQAREIPTDSAMPAFGDKIGATPKPISARKMDITSGQVYALATTSDVPMGFSAHSRPRSVTGTAHKSTAQRKSHAKSYASSGKRRISHASNNDGGSSRSCLQSSARALLGRIEAKFGSVNLISTCRPGAVIATTGKPSKHRNGMAIDFDAPGRKAAIVQWLIANHHNGGTMTYRDMNHIHVDVGYHFVSLGANSGRG